MLPPPVYTDRRTGEVLAARFVGDRPHVEVVDPRFAEVLAALATLFTLLAGAEIAAILLAVVTGGFAYGRFLLMPEIERAREAGEVERRRRLHRRSVLINTIQLAGFLVALLLLAGRV